MGIISIKNLIHKYAKRDEYGEKVGSIYAVDGVNLEVNKGDFISILGKNGSGKSTLAKHINVLLFPSKGKVYVCGFDTEKEECILEIRKSAGMVFQNPDNQIIATVVEEDVAFGPENIGVEPLQIRRRVDESLKAVGMFDFRKNSPNKLSGGQKQRVAIAGILAMKPACIILDEPTAMLDPVGRREVLKTLHKLNKEDGITVILVTHHMDEVIESDVVCVMDKGKLVMQGTPNQVFSDVEVVKAYGLDVPQVTEVAYELKKSGYDMPEVLNVNEFVKEFTCVAEKVSADVTNGFSETAENEGKDNSVAADTQNSTPLMSLKNVSYVYSKGTAFERVALEDINIDIRKGEFIALIGHTGSGKSTLIQHFNGLEKPTVGNVYYNGEDIHGEKYNRKELRGKVGMVFQYPEHQLFEVSIYKDVAFGPKNQGLDDETVKERVEEALELVGIDKSRWNDSPLDLSGGQKKRVAIAGALAMHPEVLILDEPTAGLDPSGRDEILGQINTIYEKTGMTVILVSHSMEDVAQYAKRIIVMNEGKVKYDDEPEKVFSHHRRLQEIGLAAPQVTVLMNRLKSEGYNLPTNVINVSECTEVLLDYLAENSSK